MRNLKCGKKRFVKGTSLDSLPQWGKVAAEG